MDEERKTAHTGPEAKATAWGHHERDKVQSQQSLWGRTVKMTGVSHYKRLTFSHESVGSQSRVQNTSKKKSPVKELKLRGPHGDGGGGAETALGRRLLLCPKQAGSCPRRSPCVRAFQLPGTFSMSVRREQSKQGCFRRQYSITGFSFNGDHKEQPESLLPSGHRHATLSSPPQRRGLFGKCLLSGLSLLPATLVTAAKSQPSCGGQCGLG